MAPVSVPPSSHPRYPEWQEQYEAALLEVDRQKLPDRVTNAEDAIFSRLQSLAGNADHQAERQAVKAALNGLRLLKRERLDFPDWE